MKRFLFTNLAIALLGSVAYAAVPGDLAAGQRLHLANCTGCHDSGVYTREERTVRSFEDLKHQLAGCSHMTKKEFSPAETQNLLKFLNDRYYHFQ